MGILDIITGAFLGFSSFSLLLKAKWKLSKLTVFMLFFLFGKKKIPVNIDSDMRKFPSDVL
jgi:hypothetical protein